MRNPTPWRWLITGLVLGVVLGSVGCHTLGTEAAPAAATMAGDWRVDPAASDDFDRKLIPLLQQAHRHDMPNAGFGGQVSGGQGGGGQGGAQGSGQGAGANPIEAMGMPPEDPDKLRSRLGDDLRPATQLRIAMVGGGVDITRDSDPTREFLPGQTVSRIDTSGAASVESGWDQGAFVIRAHYTTRGSRSWRLFHDTVSDTLKVTFEANNPEFGHLELHTLYRRAAGSAPG
jgi:hypothetical protein